MASKALEVSLGIVTSVGGFLEIGSIATAGQGGAVFGFQLLWAVVLGGICVAFLVEQSGRLAAVSGLTVAAAIRERFGVGYYFTLLLLIAVVTLLVLAAELGGVCVALEFATGIAFRWWALPVAFATWLLLWKGKFSVIEQGVSFLGLVTVAYVVAAWELAPDWREVAAGFVPSLPHDETARYWFIAVSILGASISPYLMFFYSSGAIEDEWNRSYLGANRAIAGIGMSFGTLITMAVLIVGAIVLLPAGVRLEDYRELPRLLVEVFGSRGFVLTIAILAIACLGAALEIALAIAYMFAQGLGWNWSEDARPQRESRFCLTYTIVLLIAGVIALVGPDPLKLTNLSMSLTAAVLPIAVVPFLFVMNDARYLKAFTNGPISNGLVLLAIALAFVLAIVAIPLQFLGGS
jgi:Mn2+/Fe2+ NRAMP family transporter